MMSVAIRARAGALSLDLSLTMGRETLVLIGRNGAGKSTVLRLLLGAAPIESGRIALGDRVLFDSSAKIAVPIERRRVGYVPQDHALLSTMSVRGNVRFAMDAARSSGVRLSSSEDEWLARFSLDSLADRRPETLSGGEHQRVALARALAGEPQLLLLDEPLASLDVHGRRDMRTLLREWLSRAQIPAILVTHDPDDVRALADRVAVIDHGRVERARSTSSARRRRTRLCARCSACRDAQSRRRSRDAFAAIAQSGPTSTR